MGSHSQQAQSRRRQIPAPRRQCCFSFAAYARSLMDHLRRCGIRVEPGLSEVELARIESGLSLLFPPDLRAILSEGLPVGGGFPDWRSSPLSLLRERIQQPVADLCSQIRRARFWSSRFGDRPGNVEAAVIQARAALERVPRLVPVYGSCYIPSADTAGNPVLLVQSGEVSVVGNDVADFFEKEVFHGEEDRKEEEEEDSSAASSSCLMGSMKMGRSSEERERIAAPSSSSLWGISPEALLGAFRRKKGAISRAVAGTRSAEASPRPSVSSSHSSGSGEPPRRSLDVILRRKNPPKGVALEALLGFTMAAPAWAAKKPKEVDFWSELCGQRLEESSPISPPVPASEVAPPACLEIVVVPDPAPKSAPRNEEERWLHGYLDDMAGRLRIAGWKEDEICEMMVHSPAIPCRRSNAIVPSKQGRQAVMQGLVFKVQELSDSLKRSGWSVQDVAEAFNATSINLWASTPSPSSSQQVHPIAAR